MRRRFLDGIDSLARAVALCLCAADGYGVVEIESCEVLRPFRLGEGYEQAYRRIDRSEASAAIDRASQLVCVLFDLCAGDAESHRDIGYYAEKMHISPRYLHRICKQSMGYTPKAVIDYVIVGKAKKMLLATGLTVQEIAGRLCFPDQATFGQYFKRNIGMFPTEFRRRYR